MIAIIDYGTGNIRSVFNMLRKIGVESVISSDPNEIRKVQKMILPGVGAFDHGMKRLNETGLTDVLIECVLEKKKPIMGICLGMQLLLKGSEEGDLPGLGWIAGVSRKFRTDESLLRVPHIGWNEVKPAAPNAMLEGVTDRTKYYFLHSYYVKCERKEDVLMKTEYGIEFDSACVKGNVCGVQFHPEKSHRYGMQLLRNFSTWNP